MTVNDIIDYYNKLKTYIEPLILEKIKTCCNDKNCNCDKITATYTLTTILRNVDEKGYAICDSLNNDNLCSGTIGVTFYTFFQGIRYTFNIFINVYNNHIKWGNIKELELRSYKGGNGAILL